jgi:hypothetical protein
VEGAFIFSQIKCLIKIIIQPRFVTQRVDKDARAIFVRYISSRTFNYDNGSIIQDSANYEIRIMGGKLRGTYFS